MINTTTADSLSLLPDFTILREFCLSTSSVVEANSQRIAALLQAKGDLPATDHSLQQSCKKIANSLRVMTDLVSKLVDSFHRPDVIRAVERHCENGPLDEIIALLADSLKRSHETAVLARQVTIPFPYWAEVWTRNLQNLESRNEELAAHIRAFSSGQKVLLLTREQQEQLIDMLLDPPEPSPGLRRLLAS